MKGYKVTNKSRDRLIGVACDSLKQLLAKGREKLNIAEEVIATLDDGTIVDDEDYFQALPPQTIVVLHRHQEEIVTGVDIILNTLRSVNASYLGSGSKAKEFVLQKANELLKIIEESGKEELIAKSTPEEDPEWFSGLETNARTKEEFMFKKSQDRIRGYLYKFQGDLRKHKLYATDGRFRDLVEKCLEFLKKRLKEDEYFGCYFDRRCASDHAVSTPKKRRREREEGGGYDKLSYCDDSGKFVCQGKWRAERCEYSSDHHINPYLSREARIVFSTWNLDHRIERSRSVAPSLVTAIQSCGKRQSIDFLYFYRLLFTKFNLKLVHVVCHEKSVHDASCDPRSVFAS